MKSFFLYLATPVLFLCFGISSWAMETVQVVGSHLDLEPSSLSGQVSVLEREQIAALNKDNVEQLLQALPGVSINRQGGAGGVTSLYVRGGEANFTVVMIDGVQVNNPTNTGGGSFDFSTLDINSIERIELIRGPQSAVYGGDALSGVLNLVTRKSAAASGALVRAELGSDHYYRVSAQATLTLGDAGAVSLGAGHNDAGELVDGSDHEIDFLNGRIDYAFFNKLSSWASFRYSDSERASFPEDSGGPNFAVYRQRDQASSEDLSGQLGLRLAVTDSWSSALTGNWFETQSEESSPGIYPGFEVPATGSDINFDRAQFSWNNQLAWDGGQLGAGLDYRREQGDSEGYIDFGFLLPTNFELERDTLGAFLEVQQQLGRQLSLSLGLRYDDVDELNSELTPRLGLLYQLNNGQTRLRANWGEGFKPPSFFALAHPLVGNPDLKPETATSWDVGLEHEFASGGRLNLAWFDNKFEDLVDFDDALFRNVNRDRVDSRGLEIEFGWPITGAVSVSAHATYTDTEIVGSDEQLRGRPEWKAGAQLFYQIKPGWSFAAEYLWVDEVIEASRHTGQNIDYQLDGYQTVDIALAWQLSTPLALELSVSNLFDEDYQQAVGFPAPGIFPRLALEFAF